MKIDGAAVSLRGARGKRRAVSSYGWFVVIVACVVACGSGSKQPPRKTPPIDAGSNIGSDSGSSTGSSSGSGIDSGANKKIRFARPFSLEVLGLAVRGTIDADSARAAIDLTAALRAAAREYDALHLGSKNFELIDEKVMVNCEDEAPHCMINMAHDLDADRIVWGHASVDGKHIKADVHLLVVETKQIVDFDIDSSTDDDALRKTARDAMASLLSRTP